MATEPGRTPIDIAAERITLGAMLLSPSAAARAAEILARDDFYRPQHETIYAHITTMRREGEPVDAQTVRIRIAQAGQFAGDFQPDYLLGLIHECPFPENVATYAKRVADLASRRRILENLRRTTDRVLDGADLAEIVADATTELGIESKLLLATDRQDTDRVAAGGSFILDAPAAPPAIWGHDNEVAWAAGESLMLAGPPGVGKTTLTGQLVAGRLGIVTKNVLGLPVEPGERRVLYLAMDRPPQIARALARLFGEEHRDVLDERLAVWKGPPPQDFARHPELLLAMCERADADTVIVDSLKDGVRKLSDDESGGGYNTARQAALVAGVQVVELHHQRKASGENKKPSKLDDVYGSTWLTAGAGSVILLWGEAGDPIVELIHLKQPAEPLGPWRISHDHATGRSEIWHQADLLQMSQTWQPTGSAGLTVKAAACAMFSTDKPTANQTEKARRKLDKYVRDGHMIRIDGTGGGSAGGTPTKYYRAAEDPS